MNAPADPSALIREAEALKFYRGAILGLGRHLPAEDAALDELLAEVVATRNELAFTRLVFAALASGRPVPARHLVQGAALFPDPGLMADAAWHCTGAVGEALVTAVKEGLMGNEREAMALALAAAWCKEHPTIPRPAELVIQARLLAREAYHNLLTIHMLMVVANLVEDDGLKSILKGYGVPEHPVIEGPFLAEFLPRSRRSPLENIPELPPPQVLSGFTVRRAVERVGRNEPCPCGSGKKYKKCCFDKDRERLLESSAVPGLTQTELRQQPELGLTKEGLENMRSYELCKLDPAQVPADLRLAYSDRLTTFGLLEQVVIALEKWPWEEDMRWIWETAFMEVSQRGSKPLLERLIRLNPKGAEAFDYCRLATELVLAGDEGRQQLDLVEAATLRALQAEKPTAALVDLAYSLLDRRPALGILAARCAIPMAHPIEGETLLEALLKARDKLGLPPNDPMCDFIDEQLFAPEESPAEEPEALAQARRDLQAKAREVRKLQKELDGLTRELEKRAGLPEPAKAAARPATPAKQPGSVSDQGGNSQKTPHPDPLPVGRGEGAEAPQPGPLPIQSGEGAALGGRARVDQTPGQCAPTLPQDMELKTLRERLDSLKSQLKERHNERNLLRRELKSAQAQIESLRQRPVVAASGPTAEEAEERWLETEDLPAKQPVRLPQFPHRFEERLTTLPPAAARSCLVTIGRLAGGEVAAFTGVKRLKALQDIYRQRIGEDYRLLFRLQPGRLEIIDLIHRRDLERTIKGLV